MSGQALRVEEQIAPYLVAPQITDHLDNFASAPEGFKRLRELVLNLAVRGRLVPQDPNDEPAERLLERLRKEKARLSLKREKALDSIADDDAPYAVPPSWRWVRLPEICHDWGQKVPDGPFTYVDVGAIDNERGVITDATQLLDANSAPSRARKIVRPGTVLYSTVRPYLLNIAIVGHAYEPEPIASTAFAVLHPLHGINGRFLFHYLRSQPFIDFVGSKMVGVAYPAINDSNFFSGLFPLPPTAEQSRIVAKVEELMALIDRLEEKVSRGDTARGKLLDTLLAALADSPDAAATAAAWAQLAPHFDLLLQTPADVDRLQQTLLTLAVKGRLVPQDPNDEPAAELLKRIRAEKERLVAEGKIRREKPLAEVEQSEKSFDAPDGWIWVRMQNAFDVRDGTHDTPKYVKDDGVPLITSRNFVDGKICFSDAKLISWSDHNLIKKRSRVDVGDILYSMIGGNIGNQVRVDTEREFSIKNVALFKFYLKRVPDPEYLDLFLKTVTLTLQRNAVGGAQPFVSLSLLRGVPVPLPPLAEQSRIVSAVASLTALCDRLRSRLAARRELSGELATALTESALQ